MQGATISVLIYTAVNSTPQLDDYKEVISHSCGSLQAQAPVYAVCEEASSPHHTLHLGSPQCTDSTGLSETDSCHSSAFKNQEAQHL